MKDNLAKKLHALREEVRALIKEHGNKVVSDVTLEQAFGGLRDVRGMVTDTSEVLPDRGLMIRGIPIVQLQNRLPEEIFYLLCTGELPSKEALTALQVDLRRRSQVPSYVWDVLRALPADSHPMVMLDTAILCMEKESMFRKRYEDGMKRDEHWEPMLDDCLNLIARVPAIAAAIYRLHYGKGNPIPADPSIDWAANYARMLGTPDPSGNFAALMRLYMTLHSDHEGGNVSSFATHTVSSALSDIYYAVSAGLNGLAGPLHGLANQECLSFILKVKERFGGVPTEEDLRKFTWDTLNAGKVIPGYGHAVLRVTDPRFEAFLEFGKKVCRDDPVFNTVVRAYDVVPKVLKEQGKAKNPWPNVDAISGSLLYHFGLTEFNYYTVLFGVSRILGISAQTILGRALGYSIVRPKSVTVAWMKEFATK